MPSELAAALVDFQSRVPVIAKSRTAKIPTKSGGSYTYKFADLSDIWDAIRAPLHECGLAVTQQLCGGSDGWTGIVTTIWHKSGDSSSQTLEIPTHGKSAQEMGSQFTYFKRYALTAALGISTEEDDDGQAGNAPVNTAVKSSPLQDAFAKLKEARLRAGLSPDEVAAMALKTFNVNLPEAKNPAEVNALAEELDRIADLKEQH